mgnify:CR=1 FL=1
MKNHVVCLSTTNYHPLPTRKQNVMSRLRNSEILYFDPPVSMIAPLKDKKASAYIEKHKQPGEKVEGHENITVYALPPVLPFFNKFRWINKINQKRQAAFIREKMREHGFGDETVLWCYSPSSCDIVEHLPHAKLVYDCVDRHSAYKGHINPKVVDKMEHDLAKPADQVFATAVGLAETLEKINPTTQMIPNGAAYEIFSRVQTEKDTLPCPEDMKDLPHPIYGFDGMLHGLLGRLYHRDIGVIQGTAVQPVLFLDAVIMLPGRAQGHKARRDDREKDPQADAPEDKLAHLEDSVIHEDHPTPEHPGKKGGRSRNGPLDCR